MKRVRITAHLTYITAPLRQSSMTRDSMLLSLQCPPQKKVRACEWAPSFPRGGRRSPKRSTWSLPHPRQWEDGCGWTVCGEQGRRKRGEGSHHPGTELDRGSQFLQALGRCHQEDCPQSSWDRSSVDPWALCTPLSSYSVCPACTPPSPEMACESSCRSCTSTCGFLASIRWTGRGRTTLKTIRKCPEENQWEEGRRKLASKRWHHLT